MLCLKWDVPTARVLCTATEIISASSESGTSGRSQTPFLPPLACSEGVPWDKVKAARVNTDSFGGGSPVSPVLHPLCVEDILICSSQAE